MIYKNLALLSAFVFIYSIISGRLEKTPISGAIVFTLFGLILGPYCLGIMQLNVHAEDLRTLAELTLAMVLFTDAANANLDILKQNTLLPRRLLLAGLPLTILLGIGIGMYLFDELSLLEIAILSTMLAPTDAALGKAVVTNPLVAPTIREGLNVESGLNDGICVPILLVFLELAVESEHQSGTSLLALKLVAEGLGIAVVVGVVLTAVFVWLLTQLSKRGWMTETWQQLPVPSLAISCFAVAQWLDSSGFIAAFVGGLLFGALAKSQKHKLLLAAEGTGDTLALLTWVVFGAVVVGRVSANFSWDIVLYAILSLTVIRMLPVFLVLTGLNMSAEEKLFIGWFGPRGLASIVFGVIVLNKHLPGEAIITNVVVCTILLSILAHGLSANPFIKILASKKITDSL